MLTDVLKKKKTQLNLSSSFLDRALFEEMQCERATGSVCEVNSTGPLF